MAAQYRIDFNDGRSVYVHAADAKSFKKPDIRAANVNARKKGEAKRAKEFVGGKLPKTVRATHIACVG